MSGGRGWFPHIQCYNLWRELLSHFYVFDIWMLRLSEHMKWHLVWQEVRSYYLIMHSIISANQKTGSFYWQRAHYTWFPAFVGASDIISSKHCVDFFNWKKSEHVSSTWIVNWPMVSPPSCPGLRDLCIACLNTYYNMKTIVLHYNITDQWIVPQIFKLLPERHIFFDLVIRFITNRKYAFFCIF